MRTLRTITIAIICALAFTYAGYAQTTKEAIDYVINTDIIAYIFDTPIKSYNIRGLTAVAAEDLDSYYYMHSVETDIINKVIIIRPQLRGAENIDKSELKISNPEKIKGAIGSKTIPVYSSDIKVYYGDRLITSLLVDGKTVVFLDDIVHEGLMSYKWNSSDRSVHVSHLPGRSGYYDVYIRSPYVHYDQNSKSFKYFAFDLKKKQENGNVDFEIVGVDGDYGFVAGITVSEYHISFTFIPPYFVSPENSFETELRNYVNLKYFERIEKNTSMRWENLSEIYKVYINGELLSGEAALEPTNGRGIYSFYFNNPVSMKNINTIRLEIGRR